MSKGSCSLLAVRRGLVEDAVTTRPDQTRSKTELPQLSHLVKVNADLHKVCRLTR